jgi:hypothetical protein
MKNDDGQEVRSHKVLNDPEIPYRSGQRGALAVCEFQIRVGNGLHVRVFRLNNDQIPISVSRTLRLQVLAIEDVAGSFMDSGSDNNFRDIQ